MYAFTVIGMVVSALVAAGILFLIGVYVYYSIACIKGQARLRFLAKRYGDAHALKLTDFQFWCKVIPWGFTHTCDGYVEYGGLKVPLNGFRKITRNNRYPG